MTLRELEAEFANHGENQLDMSVGHGTFDAKDLVDGKQPYPAQDKPERLDSLIVPIREIGQGLLDGPFPFPPSPAEQNGGAGATVGDDLNIHGSSIARLPS